MQYFDKDTFAFLRELAANNDRDWFAENKDRYEESVKEPFLQFINGLAHLSPRLLNVLADLLHLLLRLGLVRRFDFVISEIVPV